MQVDIPLISGNYYHIYNRGINGEDLFKESRNYEYFLRLYAKYIPEVADTFVYCLLKNHFHFLIRIKDEDFFGVNGKIESASLPFSHLFNSYAQSINKAYNRTGGLFETPFKRKLITSNNYFTRLIYYIHSNPQTHGFINDFRIHPHSSYQIISGNSEGRENAVSVNFLMIEEVLDWFGGLDDFISFHEHYMDLSEIEKFIIEV